MAINESLMPYKYVDKEIENSTGGGPVIYNVKYVLNAMILKSDGYWYHFENYFIYNATNQLWYYNTDASLVGNTIRFCYIPA